jgi:hypothetical protein
MTDPRPFADPEAAARKLMEIANAIEPVQDGRIFIELINGPFLFEHKCSPAEHGPGLKLAIERGWLWMHESGTYVKLPPGRCEAIRLSSFLCISLERFGRCNVFGRASKPTPE